MRECETMHVVNTSLDGAVRTRLMDSFHKITTNHESIIDKVDEWGVKELAYEINCMKRGHYIVVNATANDEEIHGFERLVRISHSIVRYMIIKTWNEE